MPSSYDDSEREHINCHRKVEKALIELKTQMMMMQVAVDKMAKTIHEDEDSLITRVAIIENKVADLVWLRTAVFSVVISSIGQLVFLAFQMLTNKGH
jgi:hypothetical protein